MLESYDGGEVRSPEWTLLSAESTFSELLSTIIVLPISQYQAAQTIWSPDDVFRAGECFLIWLHEVRHRGTFSVISLAFARLVEAVKSVDNLRDLREVWLDVWSYPRFYRS